MTELLADRDAYDVVVVGAGMGGIYAVHRLRAAGFRVVGVESAADVGGVWYHNRYPGARVDVDSTDYCFLDPQLYREWNWTERYAAQPEILAYLDFVADRYAVRPHFRFNTRVTGAQWNPDSATYAVETTGGRITTRFLVMATGPLTVARTPRFEGMDDFSGRIVSTSTWPHDGVDLTGKRVAVIGTGSSGVQAITTIAPIVGHLFVMQRTANWSLPAGVRDLDPEYVEYRKANAEEFVQRMPNHPVGIDWELPTGEAADFTPDEQQEILQRRWECGGAGFQASFTDVGRNPETNRLVADFVLDSIRQRVHDPVVAEKLCPTYPIGTRRTCVDTGYYETFNRDNVTLVDIREDPIVRFDETGLRTESGHYEVDVVVLALGFDAFRGALDRANIRNAEGRCPGDVWAYAPYNYLGLMTVGFPNLFHLTAPGSPSVVANMNLGNVIHVDFVAGLITHMDEHGQSVVEPTESARAEWATVNEELVAGQLRWNVPNYMLHVNEDGTKVFMPFVGGLHTFVARLEEVAANGYEGFAFDAVSASV